MLRRRPGQHAGSTALIASRLLLVGLRGVDRGPGGAVDHDVVSGHGIVHGDRVEEVEVAAADGA